MNKKFTPSQKILADEIDDLLDKAERLIRLGNKPEARKITEQVKKLMAQCYDIQEEK